MNTELAREVFSIVRSEAKRPHSRWNQNRWADVGDTEWLMSQPTGFFDLPDTRYCDGHPTRARAISPSCKTAMCFAGWTLVAHDAKARFLVDTSGTADYALMGDGRVVNICEEAERLLDIDERQSDELFAGGNDLVDLVLVLTDLGVAVERCP
jgi:hypothetical protein